MTKQKLLDAQDLLNDIEKLEQHRDNIQSLINWAGGGISNNTSLLEFNNITGRTSIDTHLRTRFSPKNHMEFLQEYVVNVQKEIEKLENIFKEL